MATPMLEFNSFISKFTQLCCNGLNASLQLKSCRGNLVVNMDADLGYFDPFIVEHSFSSQQPKPRRRRRRKRNNIQTSFNNLSDISSSPVKSAAAIEVATKVCSDKQVQADGPAETCQCTIQSIATNPAAPLQLSSTASGSLILP